MSLKTVLDSCKVFYQYFKFLLRYETICQSPVLDRGHRGLSTSPLVLRAPSGPQCVLDLSVKPRLHASLVWEMTHHKLTWLHRIFAAPLTTCTQLNIRLRHTNMDIQYVQCMFEAGALLILHFELYNQNGTTCKHTRVHIMQNILFSAVVSVCLSFLKFLWSVRAGWCDQNW